MHRDVGNVWRQTALLSPVILIKKDDRIKQPLKSAGWLKSKKPQNVFCGFWCDYFHYTSTVSALEQDPSLLRSPWWDGSSVSSATAGPAAVTAMHRNPPEEGGENPSCTVNPLHHNKHRGICLRDAWKWSF